MSSPITSVSQSQGPLLSSHNNSSYANSNSLIPLCVRGTNFDLLREELTALPESILLCLFPNGLLLDEQEDIRVNVDVRFHTLTGYKLIWQFDSDTLSYVLDFFRTALENPPDSSVNNPALQPGKCAIIVLKEDLDFYIIPPAGITSEQTLALRLAAGNRLVSNASIFEGLRKQGAGHDSKQGTGTAEQHLIDMLCASGFDSHDTWSKRYIEPQKACITSLALALLKQGDTPASIATSQKLLLFWRKPARKCWWDAIVPESLPVSSTENIPGVKIWARRVWTLELSITG